MSDKVWNSARTTTVIQLIINISVISQRKTSKQQLNAKQATRTNCEADLKMFITVDLP